MWADNDLSIFCYFLAATPSLTVSQHVYGIMHMFTLLLLKYLGYYPADHICEFVLLLLLDTFIYLFIAGLATRSSIDSCLGVREA